MAAAAASMAGRPAAGAAPPFPLLCSGSRHCRPRAPLCRRTLRLAGCCFLCWRRPGRAARPAAGRCRRSSRAHRPAAGRRDPAAAGRRHRSGRSCCPAWPWLMDKSLLVSQHCTSAASLCCSTWSLRDSLYWWSGGLCGATASFLTAARSGLAAPRTAS